MIDPEQFELIGQKHGGYASWAVWAAAARGPKSNIGDLSIFDVAATPTTLQVLKNDIIMVGLNTSRSFTERFRNFHDPSAWGNDFKIRFAFTNTEYYGAYMTDIIKYCTPARLGFILKSDWTLTTLRHGCPRAELAPSRFRFDADFAFVIQSA
jgi:hypothetical protein